MLKLMHQLLTGFTPNDITIESMLKKHKRTDEEIEQLQRRMIEQKEKQARKGKKGEYDPLTQSSTMFQLNHDEGLAGMPSLSTDFLKKASPIKTRYPAMTER